MVFPRSISTLLVSPMKVIVVLSCSGVTLMKDGNYTVKGILLGRLQKALKEFKKSETDTCIIVTGRNKFFSDATHMKTYLVSQGVPEHRIICEDFALNTIQNAINSIKIIKDLHKGGIIMKVSNEDEIRNYEDLNLPTCEFLGSVKSVTVVTSHFHLNRTMIIFGYINHVLNNETNIEWSYVGTHKHHKHAEIIKRIENEKLFLTKIFDQLKSVYN